MVHWDDFTEDTGVFLEQVLYSQIVYLYRALDLLVGEEVKLTWHELRVYFHKRFRYCKEWHRVKLELYLLLDWYDQLYGGIPQLKHPPKRQSLFRFPCYTFIRLLHTLLKDYPAIILQLIKLLMRLSEIQALFLLVGCELDQEVDHLDEYGFGFLGQLNGAVVESELACRGLYGRGWRGIARGEMHEQLDALWTG